MNLVQIKFAPWDKSYTFTAAGLNLNAGDYVILDTEIGEDLGRVFKAFQGEDKNQDGTPFKPVKRLALASDLEKLPSVEQKAETLQSCQELVERYQLDLKLVDVVFSLSGNRLNFAFSADGRIDFRDLVKDLTGQFGKTIRLTQIGARDEARFNGDCGHCGKPLCCRGFVKDFFSVTSDMAEAQQVVHRGSDRISGMCGRLMCCLSFEYEGYQELSAKLPPLGTRVNVDGQRGIVVGHHPLKQAVDVKFPAPREGERDVIVQVDLNREKKKSQPQEEKKLNANTDKKVDKKSDKKRPRRRRKKIEK